MVRAIQDTRLLLNDVITMWSSTGACTHILECPESNAENLNLLDLRYSDKISAF